MDRICRKLTAVALVPLILVACTDYDHDAPDTAANLAGFERHFGFAAPADVEDVHYFVDEMGTDVLYQLGFKAGPETVARIVNRLDLAQSNGAQSGLGLAHDFPWWNEQGIEQATLYWKSNDEEDYWWMLWYDESMQRVYYLEYSL
jgi:hypothetical protein